MAFTDMPRLPHERMPLRYRLVGWAFLLLIVGGLVWRIWQVLT